MIIHLFGAGALGSRIVMDLPPDLYETVFIYDEDVVEEVNIGTSYFYQSDIGGGKAVVLAERLWQKFLMKAVPVTRRIRKEPKVSLESGDGLVIDTFDNMESRNLLFRLPVPTVHVGVSDRENGAVLWDTHWVPAEPDLNPSGEAPCTHELGVPILRRTATMALEVIEKYLRTQEMEDRWVNLRPAISHPMIVPK